MGKRDLKQRFTSALINVDREHARKVWNCSLEEANRRLSGVRGIRADALCDLLNSLDIDVLTNRNQIAVDRQEYSQTCKFAALYLAQRAKELEGRGDE